MLTICTQQRVVLKNMKVFLPANYVLFILPCFILWFDKVNGELNTTI